MSTGRTLTSTCAARAALAGNPSDGFGGAVVAIPIDDLFAVASATEADEFSVAGSDVDLAALLLATASMYGDVHGSLPDVQLSASTTIPRSVGLGGSSALVIAGLRVLGAWHHRRWDAIELAELALAVERDGLSITAGLQDRLAQVVGEPVSMSFDPVAYEVLDMPDAPFFVAWDPRAAETSDTVHRALERRRDAGDPDLERAMAELAEQAELAGRALGDHDLAALGRAMDRSFDIRASIIAVPTLQHRLVDFGREFGAAVNSAGSGGSVVGLARRSSDLEQLAARYERAGATFLH